MTTTLLDGEVSVEHGRLFVRADEDVRDPRAPFHGQVDGLCGAVVPGLLWLTTGLQGGSVGLTVETRAAEPPPEDVWEDVVEVSYRPRSSQVALQDWAGGRYPLGLPVGDHRVWYSARAMDLGQDLACSSAQPPVDFYLLQFWPAPPGPDRVLRQGSDVAAAWHDAIRSVTS
ncbi:hypothetical protein ACWKSP_04835 [Micromonosporaceae bacterium Da 78-11]